MNDRSVRTCAHKRCPQQATQSFGVWSWLEPVMRQTPRLYEVCDKHAAPFTGSFDRDQGEAVKKRCVPSVLSTLDVGFLRDEQRTRAGGWLP